MALDRARGTFWVVHAREDERFPFRVAIVQEGRVTLALSARERWPGSGAQLFCLRDAVDEAPAGEPLERVPVISVKRLGRKLSLVLDRPTRRRCDFLFLTRPYKDRAGEYEQIFWRTEQAIRAHRSKGRPQLYPGDEELTIAIDSAERYAWRFPGSQTVRRKLAAGDYALLVEERPVAVVERKTFENLLAEIAVLQVLHQKLAELASQPSAALVVEAQYADFLDPRRIGRWTPRHLGRVLAELSALHPTLPILYAGNRSLANQWTAAYFAAVAARLHDPAPLLVAEVAASYRRSPRASGLDERIRLAVMHDMPESFSVEHLRRQLPDADDGRLRRVLGTLRAEGRLASEGRGRAARWVRRAR